MKKSFLILVLMSISFASFSQGSEETKKRNEFWQEIESQKVACFTYELQITPEEAVDFWPIYNEMTRSMFGIENEKRHMSKSIREREGKVSEGEYKELINKMLQLDMKRDSIKIDYYAKLLKVFPASKLWRLDEVEEHFRQRLFDRLRKKEPQPRPEEIHKK